MEPIRIRDYSFESRLFVGSGKYKHYDEMLACWDASGAQVVTVALRRVDLDHEKEERNLIDVIDRERYTILPNTAGCYTVEDTLRTARLARELGLGDLIKLEVLADEKTLLPNAPATIEATKTLAGEGFCVLAYTNDDPVAALALEEAGAAAVMPLGAPIGSGLGILNPTNIRIILQAQRALAARRTAGRRRSPTGLSPGRFAPARRRNPRDRSPPPRHCTGTA